MLVDPVWSESASPFGFTGPKRVNAPGVAFEQSTSVDVVLLTHNHYDHLDMATMQRLWARDRPHIIAPLGNDAVIAHSRPEIVALAQPLLMARRQSDLGHCRATRAQLVQHQHFGREALFLEQLCAPVSWLPSSRLLKKYPVSL